MIVFLLVKSLGEKLHRECVKDREYTEGNLREILERKTLMPEMKIRVDGIISRFNSTEERLNVCEERAIETIKNETKKMKKIINQWIVEQFQNWPSKCVVVLPKVEEK